MHLNTVELVYDAVEFFCFVYPHKRRRHKGSCVLTTRPIDMRWSSTIRGDIGHISLKLVFPKTTTTNARAWDVRYNSINIIIKEKKDERDKTYTGTTRFCCHLSLSYSEFLSSQKKNSGKQKIFFRFEKKIQKKNVKQKEKKSWRPDKRLNKSDYTEGKTIKKKKS
jgi:hypothetical protein